MLNVNNRIISPPRVYNEFRIAALFPSAHLKGEVNQPNSQLSVAYKLD